MARWIAVVLTGLTLLTTGCGSGGGSSKPPSAAVLLTRSLRAARDKRTVRFRVDLTLRATLDRAKVGSAPATLQLESLVSLARELRIVLDGRRSDEAIEAEGTVEAAGREHRFELVSAKDSASVGIDGAWYRAPFRPNTLFQSETLAGLVPQEACVHGQSEGCDRVDFGPSLASGRPGRLVTDDVASGPWDTWRLAGRLDAREFSNLMGDAPAST